MPQTVYVIVGTNGSQPAEPSVGDVTTSKDAAEAAIEDLQADGPYSNHPDADAVPHWEAPSDASFRRWGFDFPRDDYYIEERTLHTDEE